MMKIVAALCLVTASALVAPRALPARQARAVEAPTMLSGKQVASAAAAAGILLGGAAASNAIELDEATRTVQASSSSTTVLTVEQVKRGKRLFNQACATCHTG